jgi:ferric-dicitrate binding protein FerR (iron transport regulator)
MNSHHQRWEWVQRYADGVASVEEVAQLQAALGEDAAFRAQFLEYLHLDAALSETLGATDSPEAKTRIVALPPIQSSVLHWRRWISLAAAACLALVAAWWFVRHDSVIRRPVAVLSGMADAEWEDGSDSLRVGASMAPGWIHLKSGLAQVTFHSGARVMIDGPAELHLVSPSEAVCPIGRLLAEVPPPARGFRLKTDHLNIVDLGTAFGIDATRGRTEVHVFKGKVELLPETAAKQSLGEGQAAVAQGNAPPRLMAASAAAFTSMFEFQQRSLASEALRYEQWQLANVRLNQDPSLVVHLDFQDLSGSDWTLRNAAESNRSVPEATIVGCQRAEGRWREKQALEFQGANDRVRLTVPGEFDALTLAAWVRLAGLDRQLNSLFMCDGFEPGAIHWLIRNDGVLGLTVIGPGSGNFQILASPPVLTAAKFGTWMQLAVVLDGKARRVVHYVNGSPVARHGLTLSPPYRLGPAELGNWNARSGPNPAPNLIRNLSGSLDEFELFSRALNDAEVHQLYLSGHPQSVSEPLASGR